MIKELKGKHVLLIAIGAFAIIVTANLAMLFAATGSFPGLVVKNSYVAGVGWNDRVAAQEALGWKTLIGLDDTGLLVELRDDKGALVEGQALEARVGRPSSDTEDRVVKLTAGAHGYHAPMVLAPGAWKVEVRTTSGTEFRVESQILVRESS